MLLLTKPREKKRLEDRRLLRIKILSRTWDEPLVSPTRILKN